MKMLTSDPMLNFLSVPELIKLTGVSKEIKQTIDKFLASKTKYRLDLNNSYFKDEEKIIEKLHNIKYLTIVSSYYDSIEPFLKPTVQSLTLELPGCFVVKRGKIYIDAHNLHKITCFLSKIKSVLDAGSLELQEFHVVLQNNVWFFETIRSHYVSDYDEHGPIYDEDIVDCKCDMYDPIHYWMICEENKYEEFTKLGDAFLEVLLANKHKWKKISYPYDFFGAGKIEQLFPQTTFTNWLEESPDTIYKYIMRSLEDAQEKQEICHCCWRDSHYTAESAVVSQPSLPGSDSNSI
jgi:hypothetical protein